MHRRTARVVALLVGVVGTLACETPVGIYPKNAREVREDLTRSILSSGQLSPYTHQVLVRTGQRENYAKDPDATLDGLREGLRVAMHEGIAWEYGSDRIFALAELSFLRAERSWLHPEAERAHYLQTAVYAFAFLFPGDGRQLDPFDPRIRLATDLYNRAVAESLTDETAHILLRDSVYELPGGRLEIDFDETTLAWAGYELVDFRDAAKLGVRGILNRYRLPGLGAPLVASTRRTEESQDSLVPSYIKVPVTAVMRFDDIPGAIREGRTLKARLELFASDAAATMPIDGRRVPLEYEGSSALAATLSNELIWDFEMKGFFQGDFNPLGEQSADEGLFMLHPYVPGRIPIVFVHGTASSAGRWADLINEMLGVHGLREYYQPWLFTYNTGQPIAYSAGRLRQSLQHAVAELDPEGTDPALRRMVVIGHSQGGMLTRLMVTSSGDRYWNIISETPLDELDLDSETREILRASLYFEPLRMGGR